jgi:methionyl-tRNA formyltransferase
MKKTSETIVFFGSGPVAAKSLRLLADNFQIEAVITKPRPPHHKGDVPVLEAARDLKLPVVTAAGGRELDKLLADQPFNSRVGLLIDFGIIVSQKVIDYFPLGIINSHFSLLPEWRGADPITFAILSGQSETGVSLMLLVEAMDEGPLLAFGEYSLTSDITTPELTTALVGLSHALIGNMLPKYLAGEVEPMAQAITGRKVSYSRKLVKDDGLIDWSKPAEEIEREIRAFIEWPKSRTSFDTLEVAITKAKVLDAAGKAGERTIINKRPVIYCGHEALLIERLKPAGKKEMTGEAFLAGYRRLFS